MQVLIENLGPVLLMVAAVGWYVCVMIATAMLTADRDTPSRRALAACICNIPIVLLALGIGRYEIAVGMIFATSVAALTLVLGVVTFVAGSTATQSTRRSWGMILPVTLICMFIGLSGGFNWKHAIILFLQGIAVLGVWGDPPASDAGRPRGLVPPGRLMTLVLVLIGSTVAALAAVKAVETMVPRMGLANGGIVTALMLAPAMALPLIGLGLQAVHEGRYDQFVGGLVGFVFLNLCLLLPIATILWLSQPPRREAAFNSDPTTQPATRAATAPAATSPVEEPTLVARTALPYPMAVWRVDTVLLIAVGLLLLPVSLGRWSLGRIEGIGLILTWAVFMLLTVITTLTHWL